MGWNKYIFLNSIYFFQFSHQSLDCSPSSIILQGRLEHFLQKVEGWSSPWQEQVPLSETENYSFKYLFALKIFCWTRSRTKQRQILTPCLFWKACKLFSVQWIILSPGQCWGLYIPLLHHPILAYLHCVLFSPLIAAAIISAVIVSDILSQYSTFQSGHTKRYVSTALKKSMPVICFPWIILKPLLFLLLQIAQCCSNLIWICHYKKMILKIKQNFLQSC